jgi:hypothetical protein
MKNIVLSGSVLGLAIGAFVISAPMTFADNSSADSIIVCHMTNAHSAVEIETNENGWAAHSQHEGDHIKTSLRPCRPPKVTSEPI